MARRAVSGGGELVEDLLAGEVPGLVLEAIPGGLFVYEYLLGEAPVTLAIKQTDRYDVHVALFQAVEQVRAALAAEAALGPGRGVIGDGGRAFDGWGLGALHSQQRAAGPFAAHAAMASADMVILERDTQSGFAAEATALLFQ